MVDIQAPCIEISFVDRNGDRFMLPVEQLKKFTGIEWIDFDYSFIDPKVCDLSLRSFLKNPLAIVSSIEIRHMDDKVGYGLFAIASIPKNTVFGFIAGELKKLRSVDVGFDPKNPTVFLQSGQISYDDYGNLYVIDSSKKSNQAHYLQHLPSSETLSMLNIESDLIATGNLFECTLSNEGFDFTYFCTSRNIKIGEIIGCPYQFNGKERDMNSYSFFSKTGKMVEDFMFCSM